METENTEPENNVVVSPVLADFARLLSGDLSGAEAERALKQITERARAAALTARDSEKKALDENAAKRGAWRDGMVAALRDVIVEAHKSYRQIDPVTAISYRVDVTDDGAGNLTVVPVGFPAISTARNGAAKKRDMGTRKERRDIGIPRSGNEIWATGLNCSCGENVRDRETALTHRDQGHQIGEVASTAEVATAG